MSQSRSVLSEGKRNLLKERFIEQQKKDNHNVAEECWVTGALLGTSSGYAMSAYIFFTSISSNPMFMLFLPLGGYIGAQLGKKTTPCFFKEKTDPTDAELIQFEESDRYRSYSFR